MADHISKLIGETPLVLLDALSQETGLRVLAKYEAANPGASIKDRAARSMIDAAEERGEIAPGRTVLVEPTSGNTGVAVAMIGAARGYEVVIAMPESMSRERRRTGRSTVRDQALSWRSGRNAARGLGAFVAERSQETAKNSGTAAKRANPSQKETRSSPVGKGARCSLECVRSRMFHVKHPFAAQCRTIRRAAAQAPREQATRVDGRPAPSVRSWERNRACRCEWTCTQDG